MRLHALEKEASTALRTPLLVSYANSAATVHALSRAELDRLARFRFEHRRRDWLTGRNALKPVLKVLGRPDDTTTVRFPDRQVSISHGDGFAFAVGTPESKEGIGIDYESFRIVNRRVANWFLDEKEIVWLNKHSPDDYADQLIRLWTMKEAAFKSHPRNQGMTLKEFSLANPPERTVNTITTAIGANIQVATNQYGPGYVSIAIYCSS